MPGEVLIDILIQRGSAEVDEYGRRLYENESRRRLTETTSERQHRPRLFDDSESMKTRHYQQQQRRVQFDDQVYGRSARSSHSLTADLTATKYDIGMYTLLPSRLRASEVFVHDLSRV